MRKELTIIFLSALAISILPQAALAHCPLCTAGAGALAIFAASIGVSTAVIGIFIGAFALALGLWLSKLIKKNYLKYQNVLIAVLIFLATILPIVPFADEYRSFSLFIAGDYGSLLNRTYVINDFLLGAVFGGLLVFIAPFISRGLSKLSQGKRVPYQGLIITFSLLIITALIFQFIL